MLSIFWFFVGFSFGLGVWILARRKWTKSRKILFEQKNQLAQEKKMAVEFMEKGHEPNPNWKIRKKR